MDAWIDAFSARMLVCSAMSLISSTMLPISCELSPRRLMRLDVSWMFSRIAFMPSIVRRTASPPLCAISTECRATSDERSALPETSSVEAAMAAIDSEAAPICLDCAEDAFARWVDSAWVCRVAASSLTAESLIVTTSSRSASIA
jgi:ribosomal protein L37AE/L43A